MPLNLFYTMVQKSKKWPKTQIKRGSCLKSRGRDKTKAEAFNVFRFFTSTIMTILVTQ